MEHIIGIDVASEVCSVVVMNQAGKLMMNTRVATSESNLRELVKSVKRPRQVVFEECGQAAWLYTVFEAISHDVFICNPKKNRDLSGHSKTDDNDALNLAERARIGALSRVWHGGRSLQALRDRLRDYQSLTSQSTALKNKLKAVFRNRGIAVGNKAYVPDSRIEIVKCLPHQALRSRVCHLGEVLDVVTQQRADAEIELVKTARKSPMFHSLTSMPRIGNILGATILAEVGTPDRFRTRKQFWSYIGLAVTTFETSQFYADERNFIRKKDRKTRTRGLVNQYNSALKFTFKHVALDLSRSDWKHEFIRLQKSNVSEANARLTLARKAAAIALRLMKTGELYDEALVFARK